MKRWLSIVTLVSILSLSFVGCAGLAGDANYIIKVTGSSGLQFSGSYMVASSSGQTTSRSVDGTVPAEYATRGSIVSCMFQKKSERGILNVEIIKGDKVIVSSDTTAAYGVVSIATP